MSLARKYRLRFGAPRGDRLLFYFVTALAVHAGAATSAMLSLQDWQEPAPDAIASTPVEFIYLDTDDTSEEESDRWAQSDARAQGIRLENRPIQAGKQVAVAPQKASLAESTQKPVDPSTLDVRGEVIPAQHEGVSSSQGVVVSPPEPVADAKAIAPSPSLRPPATTDPIPTLPSDVSLPPAQEAIAPVDPEPQGRMLPEPPVIPSLAATAEPLSPIRESRGRDLNPSPEPTTSTEGETGSQAQPIPATAGLEGLPNPDRSGEDGPVQVAAQRDEVLGDYVAQTQTQIDAVWENIAIDVSRQPRVQLEIDRQGELIQVALTRPSGSTAADQAALEAVRRAAPFQPFPAAISHDRLRINLTFNYNINPNPAIPARPLTTENAEPNVE